MFGLTNNTHAYSFATVGLKKHYDKMFSSRQAANEYMYDLCSKFGLHIVKIWDDHHDKTYICDNGVTFYIQRA